MSRYEIRKFHEIKPKKNKGKTPSQLFGIWDYQTNDWVINTRGIGPSTARKVFAALTDRENKRRG